MDLIMLYIIDSITILQLVGQSTFKTEIVMLWNGHRDTDLDRQRLKVCDTLDDIPRSFQRFEDSHSVLPADPELLQSWF